MARTLNSWVVVGVLIGWAAGLSAAPIVTSNGVMGLEVDGLLYDIAIGDMDGMTPAEVYADYTLDSTPDPVLTAINSALTTLFASDPGPSDASFFNGCENTVTCLVFLPTAFFSNQYFAFDTPQFQSGSIITNSTSVAPDDSVIVDLDFLTYGHVSRAQVPVPGTLALFLVGAIALRMRRVR
jgi:hypothetical protein